MIHARSLSRSLSLSLSLVWQFGCKPPAARQRNSILCVLRLLLLLTTSQEFFQLSLRCCKSSSCFCISFALPGCEPLVFALLYWRFFGKSVEPPFSLFRFLASVTLMTTIHSKHVTDHSFWKKNLCFFPQDFLSFLQKFPLPENEFGIGFWVCCFVFLVT